MALIQVQIAWRIFYARQGLIALTPIKVEPKRIIDLPQIRLLRVVR
jgi:hypothetical protein